ncbi:hypothetical protein BDU57DRAFT_553981 [Ampelomyces quisqualis]|uniref:Essential protein Yae1 N-terminal domain-containing protein n=1 Tax=Ampelomyces quisqualis TaxID=50730 RepID=A0A6A5R1R4_AMPQU|nr:hypothetical protein BDU57DRAFT_553981 [Ampelomyces quisqualis]
MSTDHDPLEDPFDSLLTLEDTLYTTAHRLGTADGSRAGRIEGRLFGLEQGFEKFAALGELHGRSVVWGSRLTQSPNVEHQENRAAEQLQEDRLPVLPANPRLKPNIWLLHSLTDPLTFSTQNTPDAVADFDDRVKRGGSKAKVIERILGESPGGGPKSPDSKSPARGAAKKNAQLGNESGVAKKGGDDSMEDFAGSRLLR